MTDSLEIVENPMLGEDPIPNEERTGVESDIVGWVYEQRLVKMRDDLIDHVSALVGYEPPGIRVLIRVLSYPTVAGEARTYFDAMDVTARCTKYEPPWSCAREAEAQYQNIQFGWMGAANGVGYDESWCENCRGRILGLAVAPSAELENAVALETLESGDGNT